MRKRVSGVLGPIGLAMGFVAGSLLHGSPIGAEVSTVVSPIGALWANALRVSVVPLTFTLLVTGIAHRRPGESIGRLGTASLATFLALLVGGACFALAVGLPYTRGFVSAQIMPFHTGDPVPANSLTFAAWLEHLMPQNALDAAVKGDLLPIAILAVLFALALVRVPEDRRAPAVAVFVALRDAILVYVRWVILCLPIGGFALAFVFSVKSGIAVAGATLHYAVFGSILMLLFAGLLYPISAIVGRVRLRRFAASLAPAQWVAIGTQSSLASLPALVEGAESLGLPEPAQGFVLPLAVSVFKQHGTIATTARLLFMASVFGIGLDAPRILGFVATVLLLSFATPGIPGGIAGANFGAYVAAGMPAEGVLLFHASEPLMEFAGTLLNVTADFCAATIVTRRLRAPDPGEAKAA
ncbi:MAG TPA: cation:dicarboxylase symporter family transporter [Fimbriimonadaceae bacterium]|nr:cation:dicarboxylase symporter family transporter [Fimbriimonadaceae bacterium]